MDKSPHFLLAGEGAKKFARDHNVPLIPSNTLVADHAKEDHDLYVKHLKKHKTAVETSGCGGVGAIAVDSFGRVAAASSSGGRLGKLPGRCSDAGIVGAGLYADDTVGAAVVTG